MSDQAWSPRDPATRARDEIGAGRRGRLCLLNTTSETTESAPGSTEGGWLQELRDQRAPVSEGEPPQRDVPGAIGVTGLEGLDEHALLTRLERITALEAILAAERAATLAGFAARLCGVSADLGHEDPRHGDRQAHGAERRWHNGLLRSVADETGLAMGLQRRSAARRINASIDLVTRFPTTLQWLSQGRIPERAALAIVTELGTISDPATRRQVEHKVLAWVDRYGPMRVKKVARREAAKFTAEDDAMKHDARLDQRCVEIRPLDSGIAELALTCTALNAVAIKNSLTKAAIDHRRRNSGDERTLDQLRADIAIQRLLGQSTSHAPTGDGTAHTSRDGAIPSHHDPTDTANPTNPTDPTDPADTADPAGRANPAGTAVQVVIHCTTAEAIALATGSYTTGGDLDGYGPLPQPALWDAFRTAKVRYRLTDRGPVGNRDRYTPSVAVAQHIVDRDRTCQAPGCGQPAFRCDIDHRTEHPHGKTTAGNCAALCRHHHRLKHRGGWKLRRLPNGEHIWTTPTGRMYVVPPPDYG